MIAFLFARFDTARSPDYCFIDSPDHVGEPPLGIKTVRRGNKPSQSVQAIFKLLFSLILTSPNTQDRPTLSVWGKRGQDYQGANCSFS